MPPKRNKRERYLRWIMQVVDGLNRPFISLDVLNYWDDFAPKRYKPQMSLLSNLLKQMESKNLIVKVDKRDRVNRKQSIHDANGNLMHFSGTGGDYTVPLYVKVTEEE